VTAGVPVYEGQIVGENRREGDMNVNVTRAKKLTNIRAAGKDEDERTPLIPSDGGLYFRKT
jgi:GTP-binding protein